MSELPEKCCGRCGYFQPEIEDGEVTGNLGDCGLQLSQTPFAVRVVPVRNYDGTDCPCFEPKETPE